MKPPLSPPPPPPSGGYRPRKRSEPWVTSVVVTVFMIALMVGWLAFLDVTTDGCIVGDRYYVTTEIAPGVTQTEVRHKTICRQNIIRTKRGDERRNVDY